jgi:hypothetical protein
MSRERHTHGMGRLALGVLLIVAGALLLLDHLGIVDAQAFIDYWPLLVIAFGISRLAEPDHRCFGALVTLTGVWLLLRTLDIVDWRLSEVWPVALVVVGGCMVLRALTGAPRRRHHAPQGGVPTVGEGQ